jgi:hypothetical protein
MRTFFKFGLHGSMGNCGRIVTMDAWSPIFEKMFSSSRKRRGADAFENDPSFI